MKIENPNQDCQAGDIIWGRKNKNRYGIRSHYMVYIGPVDNDSNLFYGVMLTSSCKKQYKNVFLDAAFFHDVNENGDHYLFPYRSTYLVCKLFLKIVEWRPFYLKGKMTIEGLEYIVQITQGQQPEFFEYNLPSDDF